METRASYVMIGSIVLSLLVATFAFVIWIVKLDIDREFVAYDVVFDSAVTGLTLGAPVRYQGVEVGQVKRISLDPKKPGWVRVRIEVDELTPIRQDSSASLEFQGLTGVSFVQLSGGSADAPPLEVKPGEERPVIMGRPSSLETIFTDVPGLIAEVSVTLNDVRKLLSPENRELVTGILKNVHTVSGGVADRTDRIKTTIDDLDAAIVEVRAAAKEYGKVARSLDEAVTADVKPTLERFNRTAQSLERMANNLDAMVADSKGPITTFTSNTLPEAAEFVAEARRLSASLARISERLERNPSEFMFPPQAQEYKAK